MSADDLDTLLGEIPPPIKPVDPKRPAAGESILSQAMQQLPKIAAMARSGMKKAAIARAFGWDQSTIRKYAAAHPRLADALVGIESDAPVDRERTVGSILTEENIKRIQQWACDGVSKKAMAALLRINDEQMELALRAPTVVEAIRYGEAEREALACGALSAILKDVDHKDNARAVLTVLGYGKDAKKLVGPKSAEVEVPVTADDIMNLLKSDR